MKTNWVNSALRIKVRLAYLLTLIMMTGCSTMTQNPPAATTAPETAATSTVLVSPTAIHSTATPEATLTPMIPATSTSLPGVTDQAIFIGENYPDNSVLKPGEKFDKTFEIKNTGSVTWTTMYFVALNAAAQSETLDSPPRINLPHETLPGQAASISIPLTAPTTSGAYTVYWSLKNERGETIPVSKGDNVWVKIMVCNPEQPCSPMAASDGTSANGISVTLTNFTHDAQSATVDFCMTVPNRHYMLDAVPSLLIDQKPAPFQEGGSAQLWGCYSMKYQISETQLEGAQQIVLSIDNALRMAPPPGAPNDACQSARPGLIAKYPGLDFQCNFSGAGYYTNLQLPDGMTREQAQRIIFDAIEGAIYGPWTLTIK